MILETIEVGGCRSYILGCTQSHTGAVIDPEISAVERYRGLASKHGLTLRYAIDTHTHADHFSAAREIGRALNAQVVMSHLSAAPYVDLRLDDGDMLVIGTLRLRAMATPGHTADSTSLLVNDHVFTGDTLLIGGTGRTDLPTGDPDQLYDSLFNKLLKLDPATHIHPAHEYKGRTGSTIGEEIASNPRLQKTDRAEFVAMMRSLNISAPTHLTEALRVNMSGSKSVAQLLSEATGAVPFMAMDELARRLANRQNDGRRAGAGPSAWRGPPGWSGTSRRPRRAAARRAPPRGRRPTHGGAAGCGRSTIPGTSRCGPVPTAAG